MENNTNTKVKRRLPKPVIVIVCIFFGILIFAFTAAGAVLLSARTLLSNNAVSQTVNEIDLSEWELGMLIDDAGIDSLAELLKIPGGRIDSDTTIVEAVCTYAEYNGTKIEKKEVEDILTKSKIISVLGTDISTYEQYLLTGNDEEPFTRKNIMAQIKELQPDIKKYTGVDIRAYYSDIERTLQDHSGKLRSMNPSEVTNGVGKYTSKLLSLPAIIACFAMAAVLTILTFIITKSPSACTLTLGIDLVVSGMILIAAALLKSQILRAIVPSLKLSAVNYISKLLNDTAAPILIKNGIVPATAGVLFILISCIISLIRNKMEQKKQTVESASN